MTDIPITKEMASALEAEASLLVFEPNELTPEAERVLAGEPNVIVRLICPDRNHYIRTVTDIRYTGGGGYMMRFGDTRINDAGPDRYITVSYLRSMVRQIPKDTQCYQWRFRAPGPVACGYEPSLDHKALCDDRFDCTLTALQLQTSKGIVKAWQYKDIIIVP